MREFTVKLQKIGRGQSSSNLAQEVDKLFRLYRPFVGDRQPMAGGAQGLIMKIDRKGATLDDLVTFRILNDNQNNILAPETTGNKKSCSKISSKPLTFLDLPIDLKLYILSYLNYSDLCNACLVNKEWRLFSSDEYLWKHLLNRDSEKWRQIYFDRNPDIFRQVCPNISSKQIYLKCRERFATNYANYSSSRDNLLFTSVFYHFIMPSGKPRILMFGPGLETKTSKIVRSILTDRCMNESARFKVTGLVPGGFSGVGSGISIRFEDRAFNLVVLYSNVKSVRQRLSAENRVQQNKLFVHEERNEDRGNGDVVRHYYELTPAIQELCKSSHAFIYVIDASQTTKEISYAQAELFAMSCELWSPNFAPLLVLACRRNCLQSEAQSSMAVVRALRLGRLNKKWMVQSAEVESLDGVRSGIRWLLNEV